MPNQKSIHLRAIVSADRSVTIQLPPDILASEVDIVVFISDVQVNPSRVDPKTSIGDSSIPQQFTFPRPRTSESPIPLSDNELALLGSLEDDSRPTHELIAEEREERL